MFVETFISENNDNINISIFKGSATGICGGTSTGLVGGGTGANISGIVRAYNSNAQPASEHHPGDTLHQAATASSSFSSTNRKINTNRTRSTSNCSNRSTNHKYGDENNQIPESYTSPAESSLSPSSPSLTASSLLATTSLIAINTDSNVAVHDSDTAEEEVIASPINTPLSAHEYPLLSQPYTSAVEEEDETFNSNVDAEPIICSANPITIPESPAIAITTEPSDSTSPLPTFEESQHQDSAAPKQEQHKHQTEVEEDETVDNHSSSSRPLSLTPLSSSLLSSSTQIDVLQPQSQHTTATDEEGEDLYPPLQSEEQEIQQGPALISVDESMLYFSKLVVLLCC